MDTRRTFLRRSALMGGAGLLTTALPGAAALAQSAGGYKALVCVFLAGGMDGHDAVIPSDQAAYDAWASARGRLIDLHREAGDDSRERDNLISIGTQADGTTLAVPRQLAPLAELQSLGRAAVVANVGPLIVPTKREQARTKSVPLPARLMSHNDQQSTWQAMAPEGASAGWGGLMMDAFADARSPFAAVSVSGNPVLLSGQTTRPFQVAQGGVQPFHATTGDWAYGGRGVPAALAAHLTASAASMDSLIASDFQDAQRRAVGAVNDLAEMAKDSTAGEAVALEGNDLSQQLATVARMISLRSRLGLSRQVFFVKAGGFDTHDKQHEKLPGLQAKVASAMRAFYDWTVAEGVAGDVLSFTASDFGRTLTPNASGTDHGWGNHHLVVGGAVGGGATRGLVPPAEEGHDQDHGRGRMIPTLATDQYVAGLARWFGLSDGQVADLLPNLGAFDARAVSFS